jgi:hypothetical protein
VKELVYIYSLDDPITGESRYVGKTNTPKLRLSYHISSIRSKHNYHKKCWINSLLKRGLKPTMFIIDEVDKDKWQFWEKHYISLYKSWGFDLTNMTDGGDGVTMTHEIRNRISEKLKGHKMPEHVKENLRKINTGKHPTEETRRKQSQWVRSKEMVDRIRKKNTGRKCSAENLAKRSQTIKDNGGSPQRIGVASMNINTGEVVQIYNSIYLASIDAGVVQSNISRNLKEPQRTAGGFLWIKYHH